MPTVEEILRQSGFTDEQIAGMDQRAVTAFSGVLTQAERERQANVDFYDHQIAPSLVQWDEEKTRIENEKARAAAEAAFYRTQAEEARKAGFVPTDAPTFQPRDTGGRYVAGPTGSPVFEPAEMIRRAGDGLATIADIDWKYRNLFDGRPMPISPSQLIKEADAQRLDPLTYADRKFNFTQREAEIQKTRQEEHDKKVAADAVAANDRKWAEKLGSNPDVRMPMQDARFASVAKAVKAGTMPDPLSLSETERRAATRAAIHNEINEQQ